MNLTFLLLDKDGDGMLDTKELSQGFVQAGFNLTEQQTERIIT